MIETIKGTTPTFIFETTANIDLTQATEVWVTFSTTNEEEILTKKDTDLDLTAQSVSVFLTQNETLAFPKGRIKAQINWLFVEDGIEKRAASEKMLIATQSNLVNEEI